MKIRLPFSLKSGFTMIELLVVIAVIGVLSVAVLSSINPIEQINKGRDTRSRSDAAQLINAVDRYFSIHEVYPWNVTNGTDWVPTNEGTSDDYTDTFAFDETGTIAGASTNWNFVNVLAETAEVKTAFVNRIQEDQTADYFISKDAGGNTTMYVCFRPSSYAFALEARNRCVSTPESDYPSEACPTTCTDSTDITTGPGSCFVCLP